MSFCVPGDPKPKLTWTKDGKALKVDNKRIILIWTSELVTLEVKNITAKDAGTYAIQAVNASGESISSVEISVVEKASKKGVPGDG